MKRMRDLERKPFDGMDDMPQLQQNFRLGNFPDVFQEFPRFIPEYPEFPDVFIARNPPRRNFVPSFGPSRPEKPYLPPTFHDNDDGSVPEAPEPKGVATEVDDLNRMPEDNNRVNRREWNDGLGDSVNKEVEFVDNSVRPFYG